MRVVIMGGGIAGLTAAYTLSDNRDVQVILLERAPSLGGLAGSFDLGDGLQMEKYYHFICKMDKTYFRMMEELGIYDRLRWKATEMGVYYDGSLYSLGDPLSLLRFKHLGLLDKLRFSLVSLKTKFASEEGWRSIGKQTASDWLIAQYGERTYKLLYESLLDLKFREYADRISAAWMWARFYRLATSRTATQKEHVGYLDGGSQLYIDRLEEVLRQRGVTIRTAASVDQLVLERDRIKGVRVGSDAVTCDHLISTIPLPFLLPLVDRFEGAYWDDLRSLEAIGVVVVLLRIKQKFSRYFWVNISDKRIDLAGVIEYTNLNPCAFLGGDAILYLPHYVSGDHPMFSAKNEDLLEENCGYLKLINPDFDRSWIKQYWVHRNRFAQPICDVEFFDRIPEMQTAIGNMYITDSHQLHPHDRAISASSDLGERAARLVLKTIGQK